MPLGLADEGEVTVTTHLTLASVVPGEHYVVVVNATNAVGLHATARSALFAVVTDAPSPSGEGMTVTPAEVADARVAVEAVWSFASPSPIVQYTWWVELSHVMNTTTGTGTNRCVGGLASRVVGWWHGRRGGGGGAGAGATPLPRVSACCGVPYIAL